MISPLQGEILSLLRPEARKLPLARVGGNGDGGYLVPRNLVGISDCFSPGAENRKQFEDELVDRYGIRTHIADFSSDFDMFTTAWRESQQTFTKKWLSTRTGEDEITFADWISAVRPSPDEDWMLQMDIEGAEYEIFSAINHETLSRFRVIVMELHGIDQMETELGAEKILSLLQTLNQFHSLVYLRGNNCCGSFSPGQSGIWLPRVAELTFVRSIELKGLPKSRFVLSPHPREISGNKRFKKPLHIDPRILSAPRHPISIVRIIWDHFSFFIRIYRVREFRISGGALIRNTLRSLSGGQVNGSP